MRISKTYACAVLLTLAAAAGIIYHHAKLAPERYAGDGAALRKAELFRAWTSGREGVPALERGLSDDSPAVRKALRVEQPD